jgi:hypothetical protein
MLNFIRRFFNRSQPQARCKPIELFDIPCLRAGDDPARTLRSAEGLSQIVSIRIIKCWNNPNLFRVYFDASDLKGGTYPLISLNDRTLEEANNDTNAILSAMKDWCEGKIATIVIDRKRFNKIP